MDSFTLWKNICSSSILANVTFILFLNKCDILCTKLEAGQSFNKWVKSYNDEPNDAAHVSECEWFISAVVCEQGVDQAACRFEKQAYRDLQVFIVQERTIACPCNLCYCEYH